MLLDARMPPPSQRVCFPFSHLGALVPGPVVSALRQGIQLVGQCAEWQVSAQLCILAVAMPARGGGGARDPHGA